MFKLFLLCLEGQALLAAVEQILFKEGALLPLIAFVETCAASIMTVAASLKTAAFDINN